MSAETDYEERCHAIAADLMAVMHAAVKKEQGNECVSALIKLLSNMTLMYTTTKEDAIMLVDKYHQSMLIDIESFEEFRASIDAYKASKEPDIEPVTCDLNKIEVQNVHSPSDL